MRRKHRLFDASAFVAMVAIAATVTACAGANRPNAGAPQAPNTDAILRLVGRYSAAHACPVSETLALTNAHVTDIRPFDASQPLYPLQWSDGLGHSGVLAPVASWRHRDLALMESPEPFAVFYKIAETAPTPGDRLIALGYDWRKTRALYAPRVFELELLRIVARNLIFTEGTALGASGSCVLNSRGEVVAVNAWLHDAEDGGRGGVAVGVWGETFEAPR